MKYEFAHGRVPNLVLWEPWQARDPKISRKQYVATPPPAVGGDGGVRCGSEAGSSIVTGGERQAEVPREVRKGMESRTDRASSPRAESGDATLAALARSLRETAKRYHELFDRAPVGHLSLDARSVILEANAAAAVLLGRAKDDLVAQTLSKFFTAEDAGLFQREHEKLLIDGGRLRCELHVQREDGETVPVLIEGTSVTDPSGDSAHCRLVLIDLSELRETQVELQRSEQCLRDVVGWLDAVLYIHDGPGSISYVNAAYEKIWGRPAAHLYESGQAWLDAVHPEDQQRMRQAYTHWLNGRSFDEEYRIVRPDGEVRWIRDRATSLMADGGATRIVGLAHDVTEQREAEAELRHAHKMEAIGTLASGIAHDFNNVLQAILGSAIVASDRSLSPEERDEYLARIKDIAKRGGSLAHRLLLFSRKHEPDLKPIAIDNAVRSSESLLRRLAGDHIDVVIQTFAQGGAVLADAAELEQIMLNLVANARDAMPTGGKLTIRTEIAHLSVAEAERHHPLAEAGEYVRLTVEDTGVGMDELTKNRIFEPFFTTKEAGKGTGLGLSTVFAVIKRSGGHIDVQSEVARGTRVAVCFPRAVVPAHEIARRSSTAPQLRGTALLVENDPIVRATVQRYLEDLGLEVFAANASHEALQICERREALNVVIADVMLPKMQGPMLMRRIRARYPGVPVLYMSAHPRSDLIENGVLSHDERLIPKPFDRDDLGRRLEEMLVKDVPREWASRFTIAIVEDNEVARLALRDFLEDLGYQVLNCAVPSELLEPCPGSIDLLLTDICLPEMDGDVLARRLRVSHPELPVLFMSSLADAPDLEGSVSLMKPIELDRLAETIADVLKRSQKRSG